MKKFLSLTSFSSILSSLTSFFIPFISKYTVHNGFIWLRMGCEECSPLQNSQCWTWYTCTLTSDKMNKMQHYLLCLHITFVDIFTADSLLSIITFLLVKIKLTAHMGIRSTRVGDGVGWKRQNVSHNISHGSRVWKIKKKEFWTQQNIFLSTRSKNSLPNSFNFSILR